MNDYKFKKSMLFLFLLFISTLLMGIGYAAINSVSLRITGEVKGSPQDTIYISDISCISDTYNPNEDSVKNDAALVLRS